MLPKFKPLTINGVKQFVASEPVDWPSVGFWATCGAFLGITIVGLLMELRPAKAIERHPYDGRIDQCWMGQDDVMYFYACGSYRPTPCHGGMNAKLAQCARDLKDKK